MRIFNLILLLSGGLFVACGSADTPFPIEETLMQELMPLQGITYPLKVEVKNNFLILQNMRRTDSLFHIYDLSNYELKTVFGAKGQGPDEFKLSWLINSHLSDILIGDHKQIYMYDIKKDGSLVLKDMQKVGYIGGISHAAFINDSMFVVDAMHLAPSLYLLAIPDESPRKTLKYRSPDIVDYMVDPNMGNVFANESRIVFCYGYKKQIDFMDTDFNLIKRVKFTYTHPTNMQTTDQADDKISYINGYLSKRFLYVLFVGTSWREYRDISFRNTFLEVFDLDGNPVVRYRLNGIRPTYFAVDEENFTLYGVGDNCEPEDYLLVYQLKGLL